MDSDEDNFFTTKVIILEGTMALFGAGLAYVCGIDLWLTLRTPDWFELIKQVGIGLILAVAIGFLMMLLESMPFRQLQRLSRASRNAILPFIRQTTTLDRFLLCVSAGIGEELFFRGFIQIFITEYWSWFLQYNANIYLGIAISAILFGLGHGLTKLYAILAGLLGAVFSLVFLETGFLIAPIVAHISYDFWAIEHLLTEKE